MKFSEAIEKFEKWRQIKVQKATNRGYGNDLRQFCLFVRNCHIEEVQLDDIINYFDLLKLVGYKQNALMPKSIALRKFFEFYLKQGYQTLNYHLILIPKREYTAPRVASEEEYEKLIAFIPQNNDPRHIRNRALFNILWDTGARVGEIVSLNIRDVDLKKRKALIETEKSRGMEPVRQIFWTGETNNNLIRWLEKRRELSERIKFKDPAALFVGACRWQLGKRLTNSAVGIALRHYCWRMGIETLNAHSFRHHFGLDLAKKGANNSVISNLMGHSSLSSSFRYTQMEGTDLEYQYKKFKLK